MISSSPVVHALACAVLSATVTIVAKLLATQIPPETTTFLRIIFCAISMLPFFPVAELKKLNKTRALFFIILGFFGIFLSNNLFMAGLVYTSAITMSLLNAIIPIMVLLLTSLVFHVAPTLAQFCSFIIAFIGVVLVITHGEFDSLWVSIDTGELMGLGAVACWAAYAICVKIVSPYFSAYAITSGAIGTSLLFFLPYNLNMQTYQTLAQLTILQWVQIAYIGTFGTALSYYLYASTIGRIGPAMTGLIVWGTTPIFVAIFSYLILGTSMSEWHLYGIVLILIALYLNAKNPHNIAAYKTYQI